jgi:sugar lactone lactonase YvrE
MSDQPRVVSGAYRGQLVESPLWDERRQVLWFVDIVASAVGRINAVADATDNNVNAAVRLWRLPNWCARARARAATWLQLTHAA